MQDLSYSFSGRNLWWISGVLALVLAFGGWWWFTQRVPSPAAATPVAGASTTTTPTPTSTPTATATVVARNVTGGGAKPAPTSTPSPTPTVTPTTAPTAEAVAKAATALTNESWCFAVSPEYDSVAMGEAPAVGRVSEDGSVQRAYELAWHYANSSPWAWIKASGGTWTGTLCQESRQPDERIFDLSAGGLGNTLIVRGLELRGSLHAAWPACISTDQPIVLDADDGGVVQPDKKNPARVCTECAVQNTTFSFWSDCGDWPELWPENRSRE